MLDGTNVALGVTGSIAAVRCVELVHELERQGANVRAVMTDAAADIIHPYAMEFATGSAVVTELTGAIEHVDLCGRDGWADVLVIAPATANTVGKIATAIDDTPVTTCATVAIGADVPIVIAPAMHEPMYDHDGVAANLDVLQTEYGVTIVPPRIEEGKAKIAEHEPIALATARAVGDEPLAGRHVVVASGATAQPIDPVRVLTARASGKTGRAVAKGLYALGAEVTLLHDGPIDLAYAEVVPVETVDDLHAAAIDCVEAGCDAYVSAAAVGDFVIDTAPDKIPSGEPITLELEPGPKVIESVREADPTLPIVGFKAESQADRDALVAAARTLQSRHDLAFVVANDASVMGADETTVLIVDGEEVTPVSGSKDAVGRRIAETVATDLTENQRTK